MDTKKNKQVFKDFSDDGFPVVMEDDSCPHWEPSGDTNLIPMRECWYCKFSDFRKHSEHRTHSICRCPGNSKATDEKGLGRMEKQQHDEKSIRRK